MAEDIEIMERQAKIATGKRDRRSDMPYYALATHFDDQCLGQRHDFTTGDIFYSTLPTS
jgi:hypothetical protein